MDAYVTQKMKELKAQSLNIAAQIDELIGQDEGMKLFSGGHNNVDTFEQSQFFRFYKNIRHNEADELLERLHWSGSSDQTPFQSELSKTSKANLAESLPPQDRHEEEALYYIKEGTIKKRKDGRWEARLTVNNKQKTIKTSKSKALCYEALNQAIIMKSEGKFKPSASTATKKYTLHGYIDMWLKTYKKGKIKSYDTVERMMRKVKEAMPDRPLSQVRAEDIQEMLNGIPTGRNRMYIFVELKSCLTLAADTKRIQINPFIGVERPKYDTIEGRDLSKQEQQAFIEAIQDSRSRDLFMFYLYTGCRFGEVFREKCSHVDLKNNLLFIDGTKTKYSKRKLPIQKALRGLLERITTGRGTETQLFDLTPQNVKDDFNLIREKLKFSMTIKDLRHTFATRCFEAGIPILTYYKWLGHKDTSMAEKVYTHTDSNELQQSEVSKLNSDKE